MSSGEQQADLAGAPQAEVLGPQARKAIWGAFFGFFVDNYDIFLPVIALAPAITYFIPKSTPPTTAAIASAMIFATTLIGRPLGAAVFGHFADTIGRKRMTVIAVTGFGAVTLLMALIPGYEQWGANVIFVLLGLRLIDGIFLGGQYTSASPLAMEYCPKPKRGLLRRTNSERSAGGYGWISLVTLAMLAIFPANGMDLPYLQWGWRISFQSGRQWLSLLLSIFTGRWRSCGCGNDHHVPKRPCGHCSGGKT